MSENPSRSLTVFAVAFVGCEFAFILAAGIGNHRWSLERVLLAAGVAIVAMIIDEKIIRKIR